MGGFVDGNIRIHLVWGVLELIRFLIRGQDKKNSQKTRLILKNIDVKDYKKNLCL